MLKRITYCLFFLLITLSGFTQESSNAYLLEWNSSSALQFQIQNLDLLTGFNSKGYNNQPFYDGRELYLSSSWNERSQSNTNIIALDLSKKSIRHVTDTKDAEYSPQVANNELYFVRMNPETKYQELWEYDGHALQKILPESNVAYYKIISPDRVAVVLIENNQLNLYDINLKSGQKNKIIDNAGRSMANGPEEELYFVHKYSSDSWYIKSYDLNTGQIKIICKTIPGAEDFYLQDSHYLWMAKDQRIYRIKIQEGISSSWENIFNLEDFPLNNIGRLCVIGTNQLVFINQ